MKYSFTFKGVSSDSFPWLIVSELPPISISPVRYDRIVIDGKDGDETTPVGREAYDKSIFIGLKGNYDIDALAEWLSGSGELVMSNEPTKKYIATITEQIDFNRLVCFRTATVSFHVQPFKYAVTENSVDNRFNSATGSFSIINQGNEPSAPSIRVQVGGAGVLEMSLNGSYWFTYDFASASTIIFDSEKLDALTTNGSLRTQNMSGDFIILPPGENTISFSMTGSGTVGRIIAEPKSRWK